MYADKEISLQGYCKGKYQPGWKKEGRRERIVQMENSERSEY